MVLGRLSGALPAQAWPTASLQADPSLPERDASIVAEFEAAPWLLPPRTKALTYTGVHNLGQLLELRATPFGKHPKTMTLLTLNKQFAVMTQNTSGCAAPAPARSCPRLACRRAAASTAPPLPPCNLAAVYSMVKFGGVRNYIVATWDPGDLAACADLNLPCADVTRFLPEPMNRAQDAGAFGSHDYLVVCWLRSFLLTHLLRQGFVVFSTGGCAWRRPAAPAPHLPPAWNVCALPLTPPAPPIPPSLPPSLLACLRPQQTATFPTSSSRCGRATCGSWRRRAPTPRSRQRPHVRRRCWRHPSVRRGAA